MKHRLTSSTPGWNSIDIIGGGPTVVVGGGSVVVVGGGSVVVVGGVVVVVCVGVVVVVCVGVVVVIVGVVPSTQWHPGFKHSSLVGFVGWKMAGCAMSPPVWQTRQLVNPQSTSWGIVFTRSPGTEVRPQAANPRTRIKSPNISEDSKVLFLIFINLPIPKQFIAPALACFYLIVPDRMFLFSILFGDLAGNPGCKGRPFS